MTQLEMATLVNLWRKLAEHPGSRNQELDLSLNTPVIIGCTLEGQPYIMLLTDQRPQQIPNLEAIDIRIGTRVSPIQEDWSFTFVLQDWSLLYAFAEICSAFMQRIRVSPSRRAALREIYSTVDQWQRLLKSARQSDSLSKLRGVCGELIAALEIKKLTGKSIESICMAWSGPYSMPQDFSFDSEHHFWEVKAIHGSAKRLLVSSPQQLDTTDRQIDLITVVLDAPNNARKETLLSLPTIMDILRNLSQSPSEVSQYIINGLYSVDVDPYSDTSKHTNFAIGDISVYPVTESFPRVLPQSVPQGISELTYAIERAEITSLMTHTDDNVLSVVED